MLLALDTCFDACSAALYDVARGVVASRFERMERGHAEALGPMVEALFAEAGVAPPALARIAVTIGPGTFTGLRIGLAYAKGMALALNIPLIGIDSLAATAAPHFSKAAKIAVMHKAGGTGLCYWAAYENAVEVHAPALASLEQIDKELKHGDWAMISFEAPDAKRFAPHAATLAPQADVSPLYLRAPDAKKSVDAKSVVRLATANDLAVMSDIHAQCFAKGWSRDSLSSALSLPGAGAIVVELAGTTYGFVQYHWVDGEAEINTICVSSNHRRQYFGRDLMEALIAHLATIKTSRIFLEVAANNVAALKLYEGFGFTRMGLRKGYYADGQDAVTMSKDIAA
jgi:tRNA threonylcarbamoyl adenosine modification protein YeaZ/ribosomal-protein-alanine acetyltransferase